MGSAEKEASPRWLTRRRFLLGTAAVAGGGLALTWLTAEQDSLRESPDILEPNAFLQITPDGRFIFQLDKVEMGQGTMTGLLVLVAEELDVAPDRFEVQFAPVRSIFQRPFQMTGQSRSMVDSWEILRETGAAARAMLVAEAAQRWDTAGTNLTTDDGQVVHPDGRFFSYAELAAGAAARAVPGSPELKASADYRWIGQQVPRVDARAKVTGQAVYGMDVQLEGMLTAVIVRCPELGGTLTGFDAGGADTMPGIERVFMLEKNLGVAVVGEGFWSVSQAARRIKPEWQPGPLHEVSDGDVLAEQLRLLDAGETVYEKKAGEPEPLLAVAETLHVATYTTPYLAHATMEPLNATVHVRPDGADMWVPTQTPDMARQAVCDNTGLRREQVEVHTTFLGGGFGRRVLWDFVIEATQVAKQFAVPVKLVWTREDDMRHDYYRQQTAHRLRAALDEEGMPAVWEHRQVAAGTGKVLMSPTLSTFLPESIAADKRLAFGDWLGIKAIDAMGPFQAREGAADVPYRLPAFHFDQVLYDPGVPVSIWRSVGSSYNSFVTESFVDELAHAAGHDPLQYRRELLADEPRFQAVLDRLEKESGWHEESTGRFKGAAVVRSFDSVVGEVAEVSVGEDNSIRVHRVVCVIDCGLAVTPDIVRQQMESGILFGLTAALHGEINIDNGQVRQSNFHDYRMLFLADSPEIEVHIMASTNPPTGVGEPGTPPIAPAVANAVYVATGRRLRSLPLRL